MGAKNKDLEPGAGSWELEADIFLYEYGQTGWPDNPDPGRRERRERGRGHWACMVVTCNGNNGNNGNNGARRLGTEYWVLNTESWH